MAAIPRTRRSRVGPSRSHHQPSTSSSRTRSTDQPSHFFKIILPSTIHDMKLEIPPKFAREFRDELSTVATLTIPNGCVWRLGLEKANKKIWFEEGWQDFVEYNSINYGYFLVFRYEGNSHFHVCIFDMTATEIQYPNKTRRKKCKLEEQVDMKSKGREEAIRAARMLKPKNPSFMVILRPYNIANRIVYVPAGFASNYIRENKKVVKIQSPDGKHCQVRFYYSGGPNHSSMRICEGWTTFARENHLEDGDVCVFELIKREDIVLSVSIFRRTEYAG